MFLVLTKEPMSCSLFALEAGALCFFMMHLALYLIGISIFLYLAGFIITAECMIAALATTGGTIN